MGMLRFWSDTIDFQPQRHVLTTKALKVQHKGTQRIQVFGKETFVRLCEIPSCDFVVKPNPALAVISAARWDTLITHIQKRPSCAFVNSPSCAFVVKQTTALAVKKPFRHENKVH